jgi:hypothetical protein
MKPKIKMISALWLFALLASVTTLAAQEKTKKYSESWPVNSVETLVVNNKFGEVKVTDNGGSNVTIDVIVTVEAPERRANELLDMIDVSFSKTGSTVTAETHISRNFQSRTKFSINYEINIPPDKNLNITNKYGNTFVNILNASGTFDIQYGNLTVNELSTPQPASINLAYGKSDIESARDLNVTVQYSNMTFGQMGNMKLNSKYTVINLDNAGSIDTESRYDTFNFGSIESLTADTKYTQVRVDELSGNLKVDAGYGGIKVGKVNQFESINITSSYGQVNLGLGDASYSLDASCNYCGVSYPEDSFKGDRMSENHTRTIKGQVGSGSGGRVYVRSRYGEIKLN